MAASHAFVVVVFFLHVFFLRSFSPRWMPPESLAEQKYSEKSDVWAFGVTVYECVTGEEPYQNIDLLEVAVRVRDEGFNVLQTLPKDYECEDWLMGVMKLCFYMDPNERPTFKEIGEWLEEHTPAAIRAGADSYVEPSIDDNAEVAEMIEKKEKKKKQRQQQQDQADTAATAVKSDDKTGTNYSSMNDAAAATTSKSPKKGAVDTDEKASSKKKKGQSRRKMVELSESGDDKDGDGGGAPSTNYSSIVIEGKDSSVEMKKMKKGAEDSS
jgi:serine/threonine protein kinase